MSGLVWWMSGVSDVLIHSVVDVWCGGRLVWWMSVWWMLYNHRRAPKWINFAVQVHVFHSQLGCTPVYWLNLVLHWIEVQRWALGRRMGPTSPSTGLQWANSRRWLCRREEKLALVFLHNAVLLSIVIWMEQSGRNLKSFSAPAKMLVTLLQVETCKMSQI